MLRPVYCLGKGRSLATTFGHEAGGHSNVPTKSGESFTSSFCPRFNSLQDALYSAYDCVRQRRSQSELLKFFSQFLQCPEMSL